MTTLKTASMNEGGGILLRKTPRLQSLKCDSYRLEETRGRQDELQRSQWGWGILGA